MKFQKNQKEQYIEKYEHADCTCNKYIHNKIGQFMNIKVTLVKLFFISNEDNILKSNFVCGIEYLKDSIKVTSKDILKNKENIKNWQDYFNLEWNLYL